MHGRSFVPDGHMPRDAAVDAGEALLRSGAKGAGAAVLSALCCINPGKEFHPWSTPNPKPKRPGLKEHERRPVKPGSWRIPYSRCRRCSLSDWTGTVPFAPARFTAVPPLSRHNFSSFDVEWSQERCPGRTSIWGRARQFVSGGGFSKAPVRRALQSSVFRKHGFMRGKAIRHART